MENQDDLKEIQVLQFEQEIVVVIAINGQDNFHSNETKSQLIYFIH